MKNHLSIQTYLPEEVFHAPRKLTILTRHVHSMTHIHETSASSIVLWISCLHEKLKNANMLDMISFIHPDNTSALGCGNTTERARHLFTAYAKGKPDQWLLVPYNLGCHWTLSAVNVETEVVLFFDPIKSSISIFKVQTQ